MSQHEHTPCRGTAGHTYEYCQCGAVRRRRSDGSYEDWHVCDLCRVGIPDKRREDQP